MEVIVTGGAGFIGMNLVKRLVKEGCSVTVVDNYSTGTKDNHVEGARYVEMDIRYIAKLEGEFDICYHLAALSRVQPSFSDPVETFDVNVYGTVEVLEYCRHNNIQVIYAGSSSKHQGPYTSPYATTKHLGEELCKMYRDVYDMVVDIVRFYNVYGPGEIMYDDYAAVIGIWRRQKEQGVPLTIVGDGEQSRDFTHVEDIVDGLWRMGISNKSHRDGYELGSGVRYSINKVAGWFNSTIEYIPEQKGNYRTSLRKNNDALDNLGWRPKDRLKEYVEGLYKNTNHE